MEVKEKKRDVKMAQFNIDFRRLLEYYLKLTKPMHKLRDREIALVVAILMMYYTELANFSRKSDVWKKIFDYDSKIAIMEELNIANLQVFNNHLTALRKKGVIKNNEIVPYYIPVTDMNSDIFELRFIFNIVKKDGEG